MGSSPWRSIRLTAGRSETLAKILPLRSTTPGTAPSTAQTVDGELAVNIADRRVFVRSGAAVVEVANAGLVPVNTQTGTAYTLVLADAGAQIDADNAGPVTVTIPIDAAVAFPVGQLVYVCQAGAGAVTVVGDTGVTLVPTAVTTAKADTVVALHKIGADSWRAVGALA